MKLDQWIDQQKGKEKEKPKEVTVSSIDDDDRLANWLHEEEGDKKDDAPHKS